MRYVCAFLFCLVIAGCEDHESHDPPLTEEKIQRDLYPLSDDQRAAITHCESMVRSQYRAKRMEYLAEPAVEDNGQILAIARKVSLTNAKGLKSVFVYSCSADADGRGGWNNFSIGLTPTNR